MYHNQHRKSQTGVHIIDLLIISALHIHAKIGIHQWEQAILQPILIDLSIPLDLRECNDTLSNTIDYAQLCQDITQYVESKSFKLIETLAEEVVHLLQEKYAIKALTISVSKPKAVKNAGNIMVTLER